MRGVSFLAVVACLGPGLIASAIASPAAPVLSQWQSYGHDTSGSRTNAVERLLPASRVRKGLKVAWKFDTHSPVYGTPVVSDGRVYAASVFGQVYALNSATGALIWAGDVGPVATFPAVATSSPLVVDGLVIVGDQNGRVWALDAATGLVKWTSQPNLNRGFPAIWGSPVAANVRIAGAKKSVILVPVASNEETTTPTTQQPCCYAVGSVAALDPADGSVLWQVFTINDQDRQRGAAGASVWTTPIYDPALNMVFFTTGNNFSNKDAGPASKTSDAFFGVDASTGRIVWTNQRTPGDTYTGALQRNGTTHPDYDFGDSPELFRLPNGRAVLVAGQKSGFMYVVDARTGQTLSQKQLVPGGELGGFFSDSAYANGMIYANGNDWPAYGGGELGGFEAMVLGPIIGNPPPKSGNVLGVGVDPAGQLQQRWKFSIPGTAVMSAVATAQGVVYVDATQQGSLYALDAKTGMKLTSFTLGPSVSGPSIAEGKIFMGYGDFFGFGGTNPFVGGVVALVPAG